MKIKQILPSSLYYRFLLIILVPTLLSQIAVSYVFYTRHWQQVQQRMVSSLCQEVTYIVKSYQNNILNPADEHYPINFVEANWPSQIKKQHQKTISAKLLKDCLRNKVNMETVFSYTKDKKIETYTKFFSPVRKKEVILKFSFRQNRIESSSTIIFILWMVLVSSFAYLLSLIFSKNQISPIAQLAKSMEKFGKGQKIEEISIRGAREVRIVTLAFIRMSKRIERFITQRTLMLAGISHDLRTPLTRMKLLLAVKKESKLEPLIEDIKEMENMINSYLSFTRDEVEIEENVNIKIFFKEEIYHFSLQIKMELEDINLDLRKNSFKRAVSNIVKNSNQYAKNIFIRSYSKNNHYIIELHDDGPGVEEKYLEAIFNPFFRVDKSRSSSEGNTGLGLAISKDIILSHGGEIKAEKSSLLGGLMIKISLPI